MGDNSAVVLIVDDEHDIADTYAAMLEERYDCRLAYSGQEALDAYGPEVDIVLLDRRMPDLAGDVVIDKLRDKEGDSQIAMVTAVEPDFDMIEMPFDDYLVKPVSRENLVAAIEDLLDRATYEEDAQTYFSLAVKRAQLEAEKSAGALENDDRYQALLDEIATLESELGEIVEDRSHNGYAKSFKDLDNSEFSHD